MATHVTVLDTIQEEEEEDEEELEEIVLDVKAAPQNAVLVDEETGRLYHEMVKLRELSAIDYEIAASTDPCYRPSDERLTFGHMLMCMSMLLLLGCFILILVIARILLRQIHS